MQADKGVHQLPPASSYAPNRKDDYTRKPTRRFLRNIRWRGTRLLSYMDDFMSMAHSREGALLLRDLSNHAHTVTVEGN
jgi:signal transduction histidine kinase